MNREEEDKKRRQNPMVESVAPLLGYRSLSREERKKQDNKWLEAGIITPKTSIRQKEIIYNNDLFMQATNYDIDRFNALDYDSRNALTKQIITSQTLDKYYSDDPNYSEFKKFDSESLMELFQHPSYLSQERIQTLSNDYKKYYDQYGGMQLMFEGNQYKMESPQDYTDNLYKTNKEIADKLIAENNLRDLQKAKPQSDQFNSYLQSQLDNGELSYNDIEEQFEKFFGSYDYIDQVQNPIDGSVTTETRHNPGLAVYNSYKDQREMKDFGVSEKMRMLADFYALQKQYEGVTDEYGRNIGYQRAMEVLETNLEKYVSDNQDFWDWGNTVITGVGAQAASSAMQFVTLVDALTVAGKEGEFALRLQGKEFVKDEEGNIMLDEQGNPMTQDLPAWKNYQYWSDVYAFNTFDKNKINQIKESGGISPNKWLEAPDRTGASLPYLTSEAFQALGQATIQLLLTRGTGYLAEFGIKGGVRLGVKALEKQAVKDVVRKGAGIVSLTAAGISEASMMGKAAYDETYLQANKIAYQRNRESVGNWIRNEVANNPELLKDQQEKIQLQALKLKKEYQDKVNANPNAYFRPISDEEFLEAATNQYFANATDFALANKETLPQELQDEIDFNESEAHKQSVTAFATNFGLYTVTGLFENLGFKQYLLDAGTRKLFKNSFAGIQDTGKGLTQTKKAFNKAKAVFTPFVGGFVSEFTDSSKDAAAEAIGLQNYNDILAQRYNPESTVATNVGLNKFFRTLGTGILAAAAATTDEQSWIEGTIGGLSGANPIIQLGAGKRRIKSQREKGFYNQHNWARNAWDIVTSIVTPPSVQSYRDEVERQETLDKKIEIVNKYITEHSGDYDRIKDITIALENELNSEYSTLEYKDSKVREALTLIAGIKRMSKDDVGQFSSQITEAYDVLNRMSKGKLTQEEWNSAISDFINSPENKSVLQNMTDEQKRQFAQERIQKNAQMLFTMANRYNKAVDKIRQVFNPESSNKEGNELLEQLAYQLVADEDWKERVTKMESEITGRQSPTTRNNDRYYGSKKGLNYDTKANERTIEKTNKELNKSKEEITKLEAEVKSLSKQYKETQDDGQKLVLEGQLRDKNRRLYAEKLRVETYNEELQLLNEEKAKLQGFNENFQEGLVVSAEEILTLPWDVRADMFEHPERYSNNQRTQITKAKRELKQRDPNGEQKVKDIAELQRRIEQNQKGYDRLISNPEIGLAYINALRSFAADSEAEIMIQRNVETFNRKFKERLNKVGFDIPKLMEVNKEDGIFQLGLLPSALLREWIDQRRLSAQELDKYNEIYEWATLRDSVFTLVNNMFPNETQELSRKKLKNEFFRKMSQSGKYTVEDSMSAFEDWIDEAQGQDKSIIQNIVDTLEQLNFQRNATKVEARKQKEEEKKQKAEQELERQKQLDGKNFGFDEFKVGDQVFRQDGKSGFVRQFTSEDGVNKMLVQFEQEKDPVEYENTDGLSKSQIQTPSQPTETPEKPENSPVEPIKQEAPATITEIPTTPTEKEKEVDQQIEELTPEQKNRVSVVQSQNQSQSQSQQPITDVNSMLGNAIALYEYGAITNQLNRVETLRKGAVENDTLNLFQKWLSDRGIKLQRIIDDELGNIIQNNPNTKIRFMLPKANGSNLDNVIFEVIEYTNDVAKHHNEKNGGIIQADGKQWLVVGTFGYDKKVSEQISFFNGTKHNGFQSVLQEERRNYFNKKPNETLYVSENWFTEIKEMTSGFFAHRLLEDTERKKWKLSELLFENNDPNTPNELRNPNNFSYETLSFGIQKGVPGGFYVIGNPRGKVYPAIDETNLVGTAYVLVKAANGNFIPAKLTGEFLENLDQSSSLIGDFEEVFSNLISADFNTRLQALKKARRMLMFTGGNSISIGEENNPTVKIKYNDIVIFEGQAGQIDYSKFREAISQANFSVNIAAEVLADPYLVEKWDKAGAFLIDIAKLGTSSATYSVYKPVREGEEINKVKPAAPQGSTSTEYQRKLTESVLIEGITYRFDPVDNKFHKDGTNEVIDPNSEIGKSCEYNRITKNMTPLETAKTQSGATKSFYLIDSDKDNPVVVSIDSRGNAQLLNNPKAYLEQYDLRQKKAKAEQEAKRIQEELERLKDEAEFVSVGDKVESPSEEKIHKQMEGDFSEEEPTKPASTQPTTPQAPVVDINHASNMSLQDLQNTNNSSIFAQVLNDDSMFDRLADIVVNKGWVKQDKIDNLTNQELKDLLQKHGVPMQADNIESWLNNIEECKQ